MKSRGDRDDQGHTKPTTLHDLIRAIVAPYAKYGALSTPNGRVEIVSAEHGQTVALTWTERGGPAITSPPDGEGFGAVLTRATVKGQLGGEIAGDWRPEGLVIRLSVLRERLTG